MSIKPTPLRCKDAAGVSDIAGAKTLGLPPEKWSSLRYGFEPCWS